MSKVRDYMILLGIAGAVVALDQWTKYLIRVRLQVGEIWSPVEWLTPYLRLVHWNNTGAAFGLFPSGGMIFTVVAVVVSLAILYYFPRVPNAQVALRIALALQLGGAVGNLISRLTVGTVTDFISVGSFPVFNLADASVSTGVAILIGAMWLEERRIRTQEEDGGTSSRTEDEDAASEAERPVG